MDFLVTLGGFALLASVVAIAARLQKKRMLAFQKLAADRGYQFVTPQRDVATALAPLKLFQQGDSKKLRNVLEVKKESAKLMVADYEFVTGSGKYRNNHKCSICLVSSSELDLPSFSLRPERVVIDALGGTLGGQDINFEEDPEFSKAFVLQTDEDEDAVRRTMTASVRAQLNALAGRDLRVQGKRDVLLLHHEGKLSVEEVDALIADAVNLTRVLIYDGTRDAAARGHS